MGKIEINSNDNKIYVDEVEKVDLNDVPKASETYTKTEVDNALSFKASNDSPAFTGTPTLNGIPLATVNSFVSTDVYAGAYGIQWNETKDVYLRTGAYGYTSIQSMMKRCVLNTNGTVNYFLNPYNSNYKSNGEASILTGADGNVMVQIPKFYYKYEYDISSGDVIHSYSISLTEEVGYTIHPAFIKAGVEVDFRYYRAYEGYNSGGVLKSISGVTPTRSQTRAVFRTQAMANGAGWHLTDWNLLHAVQLLALIEFNDFKVTEYIGTGNHLGNDYGITTGGTNTLGNFSSSYSEDTYMSYRGIENWYGDIWEFIDGINLQNYEVFLNNNYYTFADDTYTGDYISTGITVPEGTGSYGYVSKMSNFGNGFLPLSVANSSSSTFVGDGLWSSSTGTIALSGGSAVNGLLAGPFCLYLHGVLSGSDVSIGSGVSY